MPEQKDDVYFEFVVFPDEADDLPQAQAVEKKPMPQVQNVNQAEEASQGLLPDKKPNNKCQDVSDQAEIVKEVAATQAAVLEGLAKKSQASLPAVAARDESVIQKVRETRIEDLVPILGEFMATRLKYFCDNVDLDHPTIQTIVAQAFQNDAEFNTTLREVMAFLAIPTYMELPKVLGLLRESFTKSKSLRDVRTSIYKPPVRSLKTKEIREEARSKKTSKEVGMKEWVDKCKGWDDYFSSFMPFARLSESHKTDIEINEKKSDLLLDRGLPAVSASFRKRNEIIQNLLGEGHCGFVKLRMLDAAIILAKVHCCHLRTDLKNISFSRKLFGGTKFWLEPKFLYPARDCSPNAGQKIERKVRVEECMVPDTFVFNPRAYPLHEFKVAINQHVKDVIDATESHPDMQNKAIFDQFWVIVPGVVLASEMHCYSTRWVVRKNEICELHDTQAEAEKSLDFWLTEQGAIHPVVLGEHDGRCYFITYFN